VRFVATLLQVEQSVGLIQQVTSGLLEEHFSQLREVSAMFAQHMQDSSRRSCGVQATDELGTSMAAVAAAAAAAADAGEQQPLQGQQQQQQQQHLAADGTGKHVHPVTAKVAEQSLLGQRLQERGEYSSEDFDELLAASMDPAAAAAQAVAHDGAGWSPVLPQDSPHPVLHFQALLAAQQVAARSGTGMPVLAETAAATAAAHDDLSIVPEEPKGGGYRHGCCFCSQR